MSNAVQTMFTLEMLKERASSDDESKRRRGGSDDGWRKVQPWDAGFAKIVRRALVGTDVLYPTKPVGHADFAGDADKYVAHHREILEQVIDELNPTELVVLAKIGRLLLLVEWDENFWWRIQEDERAKLEMWGWSDDDS